MSYNMVVQYYSINVRSFGRVLQVLGLPTPQLSEVDGRTGHFIAEADVVRQWVKKAVEISNRLDAGGTANKDEVLFLSSMSAVYRDIDAFISRLDYTVRPTASDFVPDIYVAVFS